jgi:hypothetical protein
VSPELVARTAKSVSVANQNEAIASFRLGFAGSRRQVFAPIVNWITFARGLLGQRGFTGWRKPISNPGVGKVAWRYTAPAALFFPHGSLALVQAGQPIWQRHPLAIPGDPAIAAHRVATINA